MIWGRGTYAAEGDPAKGLAEGKLMIWLDGKRLKGDLTLAKLQGRGGSGENWLLIKELAAHQVGRRLRQVRLYTRHGKEGPTVSGR